MTQAEIMKFLDEHKEEYFTVEEILRNVKCGQSCTYRSLNKIVKRDEYDFKIIPSNKIGRGRNVKMLYASTGGKKDVLEKET